jgi:hypothetical protein
MTTLSVAYEHRESFYIFSAAVNKHIFKNQKIYKTNFNKFKRDIEPKLLQLAANKLMDIFGPEFINKVSIEFEFFTWAPNGNSGGAEFVFDDDPELKFLVNFNKHLRSLYKKDLHSFCLTLADVYTHELLHCIQYLKQYLSIGIDEDKLRETIFKNKEHLLNLDVRYTKFNQYHEDIPYFSRYDEITCYSKDTARQLLTVYKGDKKIILNKLSKTKDLQELSEKSDCFYYYYDCFYNKIPGLIQYELLWRNFIKQLCRNLQEDMAI